jgi:DNA (cytosine-5)-methyltransferase 1
MTGNADYGGRYRPRLLDLFCGAGGCTRGYQNAGFYVVGVDNMPQPRYCGDEFHQGDAMTWPLAGFDVIHASPPCQRYTVARSMRGNHHPDLLPPVRDRLRAQSAPWVIENVPGAPLRADFRLCGCQFGLRAGDAYLCRPRWFEVSFSLPLTMLSPCWHDGRVVPVFGHNPNKDYYRRWGRGSPIEERKRVMGIDWMNRNELSQAIPPAYTEFIGRQLLDHLALPAIGRYGTP